jgi:hypothetical protein
MKSKMIKILGLGIVLAGLSTGVNAQNTATSGAASATAVIVAPITITKMVNLHFGDIVATAAGGTVTINPDGSDVLAGVYRPAVTTSTPAAASFDVTGGANLTFDITFPTASFDLVSGSDKMTASTLTDSEGGASTLDGTGKKTFTVGATLTVDASQPSGTYTNTADFKVTVTYN